MPRGGLTWAGIGQSSPRARAANPPEPSGFTDPAPRATPRAWIRTGHPTIGDASWLLAKGVPPWAILGRIGDLLGVNEWQEGQLRPFKQVRALMSGDLGHLKAIRLLPFAAAAAKAYLTLTRLIH